MKLHRPIFLLALSSLLLATVQAQTEAPRPAASGLRPTPYSAPVAVPPIVVAPPTVQPSPPAAPPVAVPRAPVITSCDAAGCWDSNGTRLNRQGPNLTSPNGLCTSQAGVVRCP